MIRVENGCLLWYIGHSEIFSDTWEKNDVIKGGWICFCDGPYYIFTKVKQYLLANSHLLKPEVDSGFSQTCRMELFSKTSLKLLFIFVKTPIPDILLSWMRPWYYFKYTMYPRKEKEKLAKFYSKTLSHMWFKFKLIVTYSSQQFGNFISLNIKSSFWMLFPKYM